jgi:pimeloyl-ACP methyl ester carboxylesterase
MSVKSLVSIERVVPDLGRAQWVEGHATGIAKDMADKTHTVGVPPLMPGTIIFVHGVNSEGEWYRDAAAQFAEGLNKRLGREDLKELVLDPSKKRFLPKGRNNQRVRSPVIPFYWGYSANGTGADGKPNKRKLTASRDTLVDRYGNPLRHDGTWGGGPFQNGTSSLLQFWQSGFRKSKLFNLVNPLIGRELRDCPDRLYYVHAARRLAYLVCTIREDFPNEPINIVAHSQGTMIALCALFYVDLWKTRGPDTVLLNSSPYHFDEMWTDWLSSAGGWSEVQSEAARIATLKAAADILQRARSTYDEAHERQMPDVDCTHTPQHRHASNDPIYSNVEAA